MALGVVRTSEEFQKILNEYSKFLLLKHSLICPVSAGAKKHFHAVSNNSNIPFFILPVQEARALSREIEQQFRVKHESPQALLFSKRKVIWHASHRKITSASLQKALSI